MKRPNIKEYTKGIPKLEWGYCFQKYHEDNEKYIGYLENKLNEPTTEADTSEKVTELITGCV